VDPAPGACKISTTAHGSLVAQTINRKQSLTSSRLHASLKRKTMRKRLVRISLVGGNFLVLAVVVLLVISGSHSSSLNATGELSDNAAAIPVDGQTSYDIAANVARMADLPESTAIDNQAQSAQAVVAVSANNTSFVQKPQIVATALKSRYDIQSYAAQSGDTIASIAQKFGITTNSVMWSNGISGTTVPLGTKLFIPPINGIVYTVKSGDTIQSLATKYSADPAQIIAYNDAEIAGITPGEQILIPNGQIVAQQATDTIANSEGSLISSGSYTPTYGNNGYDFGTCTWYVASQIPVPSNWGNADTWAYFAALSGWNVSSTPTVGAIAQTSGMSAWGHVAIVTAVNGGTITVSDMNDPLWDRVTTHTFPVSTFQNYITR